MSKFCGLALATALLAGPLQAQDSPLVRMRQRADSLLRSWREAELLADVADSLEHVRAAAGSDTIAVGGLRIIANSSALPLQKAAERAWPIMDSLYGSAAADLAQHPYMIRAVDPDTAVKRPTLHVGLEVPWDLDVEATTHVLLSTVAPPHFDQALVDWMGGLLRPLPARPDGATAVYVQLVTAPSEAVRRCFLGDIARCMDVLEVADSARLLFRLYVTAAEREALVLGAFNDYFDRPATVAVLQRCKGHHDEACTALLQSLPAGAVPRPLFQAPRLLLMREALLAGGRGAYTRLVTDPAAPIGARLASAAGMPLDSLVKRWRARALAARPASLAVPWWAAISAIGWATVFAFCALKSSRWRL